MEPASCWLSPELIMLLWETQFLHLEDSDNDETILPEGVGGKWDAGDRSQIDLLSPYLFFSAFALSCPESGIRSLLLLVCSTCILMSLIFIS